MDEELNKQFDEMGIEVTDDVIAKSLELCINYKIDDAVAFVEQWMAFSISHLNGDEPTVDYLKEFERKVFQAKRDKELAFSSKKKNKYPAAISNLPHLTVGRAAAGTSTADSFPLALYGADNDAAMIDEYMSDVGGQGANNNNDDSKSVLSTPKAKSRLAVRTPARQNDGLFSPVSYSPVSGTPRNHLAAPGSGNIVYTFGNPALISQAQWASLEPKKIKVTQLLLHNGEALTAANSKYMFDCLREKSEIAGDRVFQIGKSLCLKVFGADAEDYELSQVDVHSQQTVKTIGTIYCEHDGPLDASSTLLVGSDEMRCRTVRLNFSKAKSVGIFPGQVVMSSGVNPKGDIFMVEEIISDRLLEMPRPPKIADQLSFVIAAGPFTNDDDLVYDPLHDLMGYLKQNKPDVLLLIGPFLDAEHNLISENVVLAETFESFFEKMIDGIVEVIGTQTKILVVSSHRDANADPVYPTMPLNLTKTYPNIHMLPDPSIIDLNGLSIGVTSTDIMDHLVHNELAVNAGDKVKRIVNYLFNQGSFYPLFPPMEDKICLDSYLTSRYAKIEELPNILVLPSDQKCFIRVVNGCLAINPGRLANNNGGTFARFIIKPPEPKEESNLFNYVACQVRKV